MSWGKEQRDEEQAGGRKEDVREGESLKDWGVGGGTGFGDPSLTSVVTICLRLAMAPSKKRLWMRKQRRMMQGRNTVKTRIWPGGSGQKPEVRRRGDGGGSEASINREHRSAGGEMGMSWLKVVWWNRREL